MNHNTDLTLPALRITAVANRYLALAILVLAAWTLANAPAYPACIGLLAVALTGWLTADLGRTASRAGGSIKAAFLAKPVPSIALVCAFSLLLPPHPGLLAFPVAIACVVACWLLGGRAAAIPDTDATTTLAQALATVRRHGYHVAPGEDAPQNAGSTERL